MPQTFYIENDEEIISVIGRLRKSSAEENYFVFPKRALVLQSIVNLRLFGREAEKLGKKIIIVTQDDASKAMAEKAGLLTERYTDDFSKQEEHFELSSVATPPGQDNGPAMSVDHTGLRSQDIGSSDFYGSSNPVSSSPVAIPLPSAALQVPSKTIRIRNASPEKQPSLNSKRFSEESIAPRVGRIMAAPVSRTPEPQSAVQSGREARLRSFLSSKETPIAPVDDSRATAVPVAPSRSEKVSVASHKAGGIFLILGGISLMSLIGVAVYLFLPKAEIHVVPYRSIQNVDLQFEGRAGADGTDEKVLAVRVVEKEQEVTLTLEATGTSTGSAQKARGSVFLTNTFSSEPQPLVATTRLETTDGKIFRLVEGVTVPGMSGTTPGTVEVSVIADQAGADYNIAATTFTIPGFKGGPKYTKFSARSDKMMAGGSTTSGSAQTVIAKSDLEKATMEAREQIKRDYVSSVSAELLPGERILEEHIDITPLRDAALPLSGTVATSFEYKNVFKVRGFIFSEDTLKQRILSQGEEVLSGITFRPVSASLSYSETIPDFEAGTVRLKIRAQVVLESVIDREKFLAAILGQDTAGIDAALSGFPEIKKIEVVFMPQWFSSSVPDTESRVTLLVEPGEE